MNAVANPVDREILTIEKGNQSVTVPDELTILADGETPKPNQVCWRFLSQKDGDNAYPSSRGQQRTIDFRPLPEILAELKRVA